MSKLYITWVRSGIGYNRGQRKTLKALGFHRLNQCVTHDDCRSVRGMIEKVKHLVNVEEEARETE